MSKSILGGLKDEKEIIGQVTGNISQKSGDVKYNDGAMNGAKFDVPFAQ